MSQMLEINDIKPDNVANDEHENSKAAAGRQKIEYGNTPALPALYQAALHDLVAQKYGAFNWREKPIKMRDYISALRRHLALIEAGEDVNDESGLPQPPI